MTKRMKMVTINVKLLLFFNRSSARLVAVLMRHSLVSISCSRSSCTRANVSSGRHSHCRWHCLGGVWTCHGWSTWTHQKPVLQPHFVSDRQADMFRARYQHGQVLQLVVLVCRNTEHVAPFERRHIQTPAASNGRPGGVRKTTHLA
jgi:hypothetical protein